MALSLVMTVKPISPAAFLPFGRVIGPSEGEPDFLVDWAQGMNIGFDAEEPTDLLFMEYRRVPFECDLVERHFRVTQAFIPLAGTASIMVVAEPTPPSTIPAPENFRAFFVPGRFGVMLWKATWHAVTRYPIPPSGGTFALLTGRETQAELKQASKDGTRPTLTETVSLVERYGTRLEFASV